MFARELSDDLASLVKAIDTKVGENDDKKMAGFVVLLTDDPDTAVDEVKKFGAKNGIKHVPLTVFDGTAGPENYKIAKDADVTIHLWVKHKVEGNHAFSKGQLNKEAIAKVVADTGKILN